MRSGYLAKMGGPATQVYVALLSYTDQNFKEVWPSYSRLADDTGMSRRSVIRAMKVLEDVGLIEKMTRKSRVKGNQTNFFQFITPGDSHDTRGSDIDDTRDGDTQDGGLVSGVTPKQEQRSRYIKTTTIEVDLDPAVVALFKKLKLDESAWDQFADVPVNRILALGEQASKKASKNPAGWLRKALSDDWDLSGVDKDAWKIQCDRVRKSSTHLVSKKTGKHYEIVKWYSGPGIQIETPDGYHVLSTESQLGDFTYYSVE